MAKLPSSSFFRQPSSASIFVDSNLDTHLMIVVSPDDTVADLKGIIRAEHAFCFPNIGEISIEAIKVKHRAGASFYHLSDSTVIKKAFEWCEGSWFLYIDVVATKSTGRRPIKPAGAIMSESEPQIDNHDQIQTVHDASMLLIVGEHKHQDFVANGLGTEIGIVQTSVSPSGKEIDKRRDDERPDTEELITEGNAVVGSEHQQEKVQVANKENREEEGENHENAVVGADVDVHVAASKKEKSRKRINAEQSDQFSDDKSEDPCVQKKRQKKEKGGFLKEPVHDQHTENNSEMGVHTKETTQLETVTPESSLKDKQENNLVASEGINAAEAKQRRKKKKHLSPNDVTPQTEPVDNPLNKIVDPALGKQSAEELVSSAEVDPLSINLETSTHTTEGPLCINNTEVSKEFNNADISKEPEQHTDHAELALEIPANSHGVRKKLKTKKDTSSKPGAIDSSAKPINEGNIDEPQIKVSDLATDADMGNKVVPESAAPSEIGAKSSQRSRKKKSEKTELLNAHLNADEAHDPAENQNKTTSTHEEHPSKEVKRATAFEDTALVESAVPSSPNDRKKKRSKKISEKIEQHNQEVNQQSSTPEAVDASVNQVIEELTKEISSTHPEHANKESKEATTLGETVQNPSTVQSIVPSNPNDKKPKRSRKKSEIIESNENPKAPAKDNIGEPVAVANSAAVESTVPLNPSEKKLKRIRKKSEKTESLSKESSKNEGGTKENTGEALNGINSNITANTKAATILKEAAGLESTTELNSVITLSANENLEKVSGISDKKSLGSEFNATVVETIEENINEENTMEPVHEAIHKGSGGFVEAEDQTGLPKSDNGKIDFIKFFDPNASQLEETDTKKTSKEKTKRKKKLNLSPQDMTSNFPKPSVSSEEHIIREQPQIAKEIKSRKKVEKKEAHTVHKSDVRRHGKNSTSKLQSFAHDKVNDIMVSASQVPKNKNYDASPDLAASSDTTEEDGPMQKKRYRVAVRKIPNKRFGNVLDKSNVEKVSLAPSATIFDDVDGGSSDDEFEISNRRAPGKATSDNSSASSDSEAEPNKYGEVDMGTNGTTTIGTETPNWKREDRPKLTKVLKSSSTFKKAKISASQSEFRDSESQEIDMVPETEPQ